MRNAFLTKTLLCGMMATTFFLINCQKAPSRGVKAKTADGAQADAAADAKPTAQDVLIECPPTFAEKYNISNDLVESLKKEKMDGLTDGEQAALSEKIKMIEPKVQETLAQITNAKAEATGCISTDKNGKKVSHLSRTIKDSFYKLVNKAKANNKIDEGVSSRSEQAKKEYLERQGKREIERSAKGLEQNMQFVISDALVKVLKESNVGYVYFKAGQIIQAPSDETKKKDLEDTKLTLCELGSGTGDVEKDVEAKVNSIDAPSTQDVKSNRYKLTVRMSAGSALINFDCVLADAKKNVYGAEFREVFRDNLLTKAQAQIKSEAAAAEKKKVTTEQAKAVVAKKQEVVDAAIKAVKDAQAAITAKETEIAAIKDDKEKAKATEEKQKLVAQLEQLKKDLETAQKQKAEADAALKKLEDTAVAKD